jgi:hypothetical protein
LRRADLTRGDLIFQSTPWSLCKRSSARASHLRPCQTPSAPFLRTSD